MTVITDTSVVLNLALLGQERVLPVLFGEVWAPESVREEFVRLAGGDRRFTGLDFPEFIKVTPLSRHHSILDTPRLDRGEREALALALELGADRVLMDERAGRAAAHLLGITCIGLLGILLEAKRNQLVGEVAPLLNILQTKGRFWISPALHARVLHLAGESGGRRA